MKRNIVFIGSLIFILFVCALGVQSYMKNKRENVSTNEQVYVPDVDNYVEPIDSPDVDENGIIIDDGKHIAPRYDSATQAEPEWKSLGEWEVDVDSLTNYSCTTESFSQLMLEQMIGSVIINEGKENEVISVVFPDDMISFDSDNLIYDLILHGDVDYKLQINTSNYTYIIDNM